MQNKQKIVSAVVLAACSGIGLQAQAVLPANAILKFDPGVAGGYYNFIQSCFIESLIKSNNLFVKS